MIKLLLQTKDRNFLKLWLAQLISQFGDRVHQLALLGLVAQRAHGSAFELAKLLAFTIIPVFIVQPVAGVLIDRWDRRTTLFVCDLIRGALVLTIPTIFIFWSTMIPIYIIVFLAFCCSRFYVPTKMSIIPELVHEENLVKANSLVTSTGMIAFVLGASIGGLLIEWFGPRLGFTIDAMTFFISAILLWSINLSQKLKMSRARLKEVGRVIVQTVKRSIFTEIKDSFVYLFKQKDIRFIICILFVLLAAAGAIYIVLIVFIQQVFGSVTKHIGGLAISLGLGLFLGVLSYGRWGKKSSIYQTIFFCLISGGLMLIVFAVMVKQYPNVWVASVLAILLGMMMGPIFIASNTIVHVASDEKMRGKVFSALEIVIHFAFLIAMLVSSWLCEFVERMWIIVGVGGLCMAIGILGAIMNRK